MPDLIENIFLNANIINTLMRHILGELQLQVNNIKYSLLKYVSMDTDFYVPSL